jgi:hypothetical protein
MAPQWSAQSTHWQTCNLNYHHYFACSWQWTSLMFDFLSITQHINYSQLLAPKGANYSYPQYGHLKHTNNLIKHMPLLFQVRQTPHITLSRYCCNSRWQPQCKGTIHHQLHKCNSVTEDTLHYVYVILILMQQWPVDLLTKSQTITEAKIHIFETCT